MKRLVLAVMSLGLLVSGCAVGEPLPPTNVMPASITLNANVYSSIDGPTEYWFRYGEPGAHANWSDSLHQTVEISGRDAHPVSAPLVGLEHSHRYGWQVCAADREEDPPRVVCSKEQRFGTQGDSVSGLGIDSQVTQRSWSFDARGGPDGENPTGAIVGISLGVGIPMKFLPVRCLRVSGANASIGTDEGFYRVTTNRMRVDPLEGSDPGECPQPITFTDGIPFPGGGPLVFDAP